MPKPQGYQDFRVYKANKANTGSALQIDLNVEREAVFLEVAKQVAEQRFDWQNKLTIKLSTTDIGKILSLLHGKTQGVKLFHDPGKGQYESSKEMKNNVLEMAKSPYGYSVKVSQQSSAGELSSIGITVAEDEAIIMRMLLEKAIEKIYNW